MDSKIFLLIQEYAIFFQPATIYLVAKQLVIWGHRKQEEDLATKNMKEKLRRQAERGSGGGSCRDRQGGNESAGEEENGPVMHTLYLQQMYFLKDLRTQYK